MAIRNLAALEPGDVIIGTVGEGALQGHTMIVLKKLDDEAKLSSWEVAHCPGPAKSTVVERLEAAADGIVEGDGPEVELYAYRREDSTAPAKAAQYARAWSTKTQTIYGATPGREVANASRARGVAIQYDHGRGSAPAFEYDALYRMAKWAHRALEGSQFSENRGTTCCAFVMACHQAASLVTKEALLPKQVKKLYEGLRKGRADKRPKFKEKERLTGTAKRDYSNVGSKVEKIEAGISKGKIDRLYRNVLSGATGFPVGAFKGKTIAGDITPAMKVDAKFTYTLVLKQRLEAPKSGWKAV